MQAGNKTLRFWGMFLFSAGILLGMVVFGLLTWASTEAYFYFGYGAPADKPLGTLRCPRLMTTAETGSVTITLTNTDRRTVAPTIQADISYIGVTRTDRQSYNFAPGETRRLRWTVSSGDVVFGSLILAQVYVNSYASLPSRQGTCGTLVVDLPQVSGEQIFAGALTTSLLCLVLGWGLWIAANRPMKGRRLDMTRAMILLTAVVLAGLTVSLEGWWGAGIICFALATLVIFVAAGTFIQTAR